MKVVGPILAAAALTVALVSLYLALTMSQSLDSLRQSLQTVHEVARQNARNVQAVQERQKSPPVADRLKPEDRGSARTDIPKPAPSPAAGKESQPPRPAISNAQAEQMARRIAVLEDRLKRFQDSMGPAVGNIEQLDNLLSENKAVRETLRDNRFRFKRSMTKEQAEAPEQFKTVQELYKDGLDALRDTGDTAALSQIIEEFPDSKRAPCSAIQLAQRSLESRDIANAEKYLNFALERGDGAYFGDGVEVAPQALFYLGILEAKRDNQQAATDYWDRLLTEFPLATSHSGVPLKEIIESELSYMSTSEEK